VAHEDLHEPFSELSQKTKNMHRAIISLVEELEAVDWYNQRADICEEPELKAILIHKKKKKKEHAAMLIEWIRRNDKAFDDELHDYLYTEKSIAGLEKDQKPD